MAGCPAYWVEAVAIGAVALATLWSSIIIRSWQLTRPRPERWGSRAVGAVLVTVLCTALIVPFAFVVRTAVTLHSTLTSVLAPAEPASQLPPTPRGPTAPISTSCSSAATPATTGTGCAPTR